MCQRQIRKITVIWSYTTFRNGELKCTLRSNGCNDSTVAQKRTLQLEDTHAEKQIQPLIIEKMNKKPNYKLGGIGPV